MHPLRRTTLASAAASLLFAPAGVALANPGVPSLHRVPSAVLADDNSVGAPGVQKYVTFGWQEVAFDRDGTDLRYQLCASAFGVPNTCAFVAGGGDPSFESAQATLPLVDGRAYDVSVQAIEDCRIAFPLTCFGTRTTYGPTVHTVADFVAPSLGTLTINGGERYTNRLTVAVAVAGGSDGGSGVGSAQVGTDFTLPCSLLGVLPTCPFALSGGAGTKNVDLTSPDGLKFLYGRMRDRADHPTTSGGLLFANPKPGNASALMSSTITVDTTPPVPALASATLTGVAGEPVSFDAGGSTDDGSGVNPAGFDWTFGDAATADGAAATVTHVYPGPGSYTGRVVVHDRAGHSGAPTDTNLASLAFTVTVSAAPVAPPSAPPPPPGGTPPPVPDPPTEPPAPSTPPAPTPPVAPGGGTPVLLRGLAVSGRPTSGHPFRVNVQVGAPGIVVAVLRNREGRVVQRLSHRHRSGLIHLSLRGRRAGRYTLTVSLGKARKTIKLRIRS